MKIIAILALMLLSKVQSTPHNKNAYKHNKLTRTNKKQLQFETQPCTSTSLFISVTTTTVNDSALETVFFSDVGETDAKIISDDPNNLLEI
ncbi:hypothetical protein HK099_002396 [Clydaea vesicula]|uniref:Uncharacterized protein n=1 Tax=Clydaea vesicula TaxID=447962 RepID=A0AAD5U2Z4_9FUNG|nr:hypothetical protein HK099_002396 [Clydaea vesicula]KAJ3377982.1 hypothetical protein HDU92_007783 [Lobulomyces angularis]